MAFEFKFNPFLPGQAADPGMFEGRAAEIDVLAKALNQTRHGHGSHAMVTGERGIGKTSLLSYLDRIARNDLPDTDTPFDFATLLTDLAGVSTHAGITRRVGVALERRLRAAAPMRDGVRQIWEFLSKWEILGVRYDKGDDQIDAEAAFDILVDKLAELERTGLFQGTLILLDEADDPPLDARLATWLKMMIERLDRNAVRKVMLVLAAQDSVRDKLFADHQSVLRNLQWVTLRALSDDGCHAALKAAMVRSAEKNGFQTGLAPDAADRIVALSDGYPHFLQQYGFSAFDHDTDNLIDVGDVAASAPAATMEIGAKFFAQSYRASIGSDDYRQVLHFVAQAGADWLTRKDIVARSGVREAIVNNALRRLVEIGFLERDSLRDGFYRIPTRAFAAWLLEIEPRLRR